MPKNLKGLLLAGGKSLRMGEDKAHLVYQNNQAEWRRIVSIMEEFCESVYVSCRPEQANNFNYPVITDSGNGPLAAIFEAYSHCPSSSWLVIACDLPLLDKFTLSQLIESRDTSKSTTHFLSSTDGLAEPLCAIYEDHYFSAIEVALSNKIFCPRRLLEQSDSKSIKLDKPHALMNANSKADKLEITAILNGNQSEKTVNIKYFAQLREIVGSDSEFIKTMSVTPAGIFEQVKATHSFPHKQKQLMVAINGDFANWDTLVADGDEIVFIPPVAGG